MKIIASITDSAGVQIVGLQLSNLEEKALRCYVEANASEVKINATRADFCEQKRTGETAAISTSNGQDILDDGYFEGRLIGGTWQNISNFTNALSLGAIAKDAYVAFEIRLNIPTNLVSYNTSIIMGLAIRCLA